MMLKADSETLAMAILLAAIIAFILCVPGCGTRTVYVPDGSAVKLAQDVGQAPAWWPFRKWPGDAGIDVWVKDDTGKLVKGKMILPEGWYCLPMPPEETEIK